MAACEAPVSGAISAVDATGAADATPLLALDGVSRRFTVRRGWFGEQRELTAVDGVSLGLRRGESLGLVGESGCGKSTLGRLVCGLLAPSAGRVLLEGRALPPAGADSWAAGRIQMVFQDPFSSLNPRLSVRASVAEPLAARSMPRAERRRLADEMLATVGLKGVGGRYPHEFSGGQRQRIAVARALVTSPDVIVCDEPVSALDASVQAQVLNLLCDVQERFSPAYLFISHDLAVVGSYNFDMRSTYLDTEMMLVFYGDAFYDLLEANLMEMEAQCLQVSEEGYLPRAGVEPKTYGPPKSILYPVTRWLSQPFRFLI